MNAQEIAARLAEPFEPEEVKWLPKVVSGNRAMAIAYVNARAIMERLDDVVGIDSWQDEYMPQGNGTVICKLSIYIDSEWIAKMDIGGQSEQPDEGDREKSAFSDALKRAAVKFGIGRYLYRLPVQWADFDPQKKRFTSQPSLPAWALPKKNTSEPAKRDNPSPPKAAANGGAASTQMPKTGAELLERMLAKDKRESVAKLIRPNELVQYIRHEGMELGYPDDIGQWNAPHQIKFAWHESIDFLDCKRDHRITPAQQRELKVECEHRGKEVEGPGGLWDELQVTGWAQIPEMHYQEIMRNLKERPIKPVVALSEEERRRLNIKV